MSTRLLASKKTGRDVKKSSSSYFCSETERMLLKALHQCFSIGIHTLSIGVAVFLRTLPGYCMQSPPVLYLTKKSLIQIKPQSLAIMFGICCRLSSGGKIQDYLMPKGHIFCSANFFLRGFSLLGVMDVACSMDF